MSGFAKSWFGSVDTSAVSVSNNSIPRKGTNGFEDSALTNDGDVVKYDPTRSVSDLYHLVDKKYVDEAVTSLGARYYMIDTDSGEADYKMCSTTPSSDPEESISKTDLVNDQYMAGWIAPNTNEPDKLIAGVYNWRIYAAKTSGNKTLRFYWKLIERKGDDSETVVGTSVVSNEVMTGKNCYIIPLTLSADHDIASNSYIVGKIYADVTGQGTAPDVALYYEGDSDSHWEIPINTEILNGQYVNIGGDTMTGPLTAPAFNLTTQQLTDAASINWDMSLGGFAYVTLAGNRTLSNPTNVRAGARYTLKVIQDATGNRTMTFDTNFKFSGGTSPTLTNTAGAVDLLEFIAYDSSTLCLVNFVADLK